MKRFNAWFIALTQRIENDATPFRFYLLLFIALLSIRLTLEFFSSHRLFSLDDVIHIALWFCFIVLAFLLQLHLFAKEHIGKVARLVIVCYAASWSAPIFDLLFGAPGAKMNYLGLNTFEQAITAYFTVGGTSMMRGATVGIRIEIVTLVLASFNYVRLKTGSLLRALFAGFSIYTVLFLSGALPAILGLVNRLLELQYGANDNSTVLLLLTVDVILLALALQRAAPEHLASLRRQLSWAGLLVALAFAVVGASLARAEYAQLAPLNPTTLYWPGLALMAALCFAFVAASFRIDPTEPLNDSTRSIALAVAASCALAISGRMLFHAALVGACVFVLEAPPARLKRIPVAGAIAAAGVCVASALAGFSLGGGPMVGFPSASLGWVVLAALVCGTAVNVRARRASWGAAHPAPFQWR